MSYIIEKGAKERALLRLDLVSKIAPVLIKQSLETFTPDSNYVISKKALIAEAYTYVDEMIAQSGLDKI